jgi:hypothetical protein
MPAIRINIKGLVKFMTASPAAQRKVLQDFKYPSEPEPAAMRGYYAEAQRAVRAYHKYGYPRSWLRERAKHLADQARFADASARATRLRHNARALLQYEEHFGTRRWELLPAMRFLYEAADVRVAVVPDLVVRQGAKLRIVSIAFGTTELSEIASRIRTQCMYEAATRQIPTLTASCVTLLTVSDGSERGGARAGARTTREIEAACQNIRALWDGIEPPPARRRVA